MTLVFYYTFYHLCLRTLPVPTQEHIINNNETQCSVSLKCKVTIDSHLIVGEKQIYRLSKDIVHNLFLFSAYSVDFFLYFSPEF